MKRIFLLTALAALSAASCTLDETREISMERGIGFRISFDKTRATEVTTATLGEFWVTSFYTDSSGTATFFSDVSFTGTSGGHYNSEQPYYWPDGELTFYAYSPSKDSLGGTLTINKTEQKIEGYSPKPAVADQQDFIFAKATGTKTANEVDGVPLTFNHALSEIEILAQCSSTLWKITVDSVKICEPVGKATFYFDTVGVDASWKIPETPAKTTYSVKSGASPVAVGTTSISLMGSSGNAMLIPQQLTAWENETDSTNIDKGAYLALKIKATNTVSGEQYFPRAVAGGTTPPEYGWVAVPVGTKWEQGKHYRYVLDFTNGLGFYPPDTSVTPDTGVDIPDDPGDPVAKDPILLTVDMEQSVHNRFHR